MLTKQTICLVSKSDIQYANQANRMSDLPVVSKLDVRYANHKFVRICLCKLVFSTTECAQMVITCYTRCQGFTLTRAVPYGSKARSPRTGRVTGSESRRQSELRRTAIFFELKLRTWTNYFSKSNSNKNLELFEHERRTRTRSTQLWSKARNSWGGPLFADRLKAQDKIHIRDLHMLICTGQKPSLAWAGLAHGPGQYGLWGEAGQRQDRR